jgi:hypothetical protein
MTQFNLLQIKPSIMRIAVPFRYVFFGTDRAGFTGHMVEMYVLPVTFTKAKVLDAVIIPYMVDVVNFFLGLKIPSNAFLHDKSVFSDETVSVAERMIGSLNHNVSISINIPFATIKPTLFHNPIIVGT